MESKSSSKRKRNHTSRDSSSCSSSEDDDEHLGHDTKRRATCVHHRQDVIVINGVKVHLEEYLGRGAYGNVYLGSLGSEKIAIKYFKESAKKFFLNEIDCLIKVRNHSHRVVNLLGFGSVENSHELFMAFEYIGEHDLRSIIREGNEIPIIKKEEMMLEMLHGLSEIHSSGVCHHDLKPENVLISTVGLKPIIADFGLASCVGNSFRSQAKGTLLYMPPECFIETPFMSFCSDVWSLGVLFYEFISGGYYPFQAKDRNQFSKRVLKEPPEPLHNRITQSISKPWLHAIFDMMLVADPTKRSNIDGVLKYLEKNNITFHSVTTRYQGQLLKNRKTMLNKIDFGENEAIGAHLDGKKLTTQIAAPSRNQNKPINNAYMNQQQKSQQSNNYQNTSPGFLSSQQSTTNNRQTNQPPQTNTNNQSPTVFPRSHQTYQMSNQRSRDEQNQWSQQTTQKSQASYQYQQNTQKSQQTTQKSQQNTLQGNQQRSTGVFNQWSTPPAQPNSKYTTHSSNIQKPVERESNSVSTPILKPPPPQIKIEREVSQSPPRCYKPNFKSFSQEHRNGGDEKTAKRQMDDTVSYNDSSDSNQSMDDIIRSAISRGHYNVWESMS